MFQCHIILIYSIPGMAFGLCPLIRGCLCLALAPWEGVICLWELSWLDWLVRPFSTQRALIPYTYFPPPFLSSRLFHSTEKVRKGGGIEEMGIRQIGCPFPFKQLFEAKIVTDIADPWQMGRHGSSCPSCIPHAFWKNTSIKDAIVLPCSRNLQA